MSILTSKLTSAIRFGAGGTVGELGKRPEKLPALYEFEVCPFCRKVREVLSVLDLEVMIYPCPKNGPRFRPQVIREGGRSMFPYLVDDNTGRSMYESGDIIRYLFKTYGTGHTPISLTPALTTVGCMVASSIRADRGRFYRSARAPEQPLELYGFEASPHCRVVRETLCELEIPYHLHNIAKGSPSRDAFVERSGKMLVPFLVDPNTDTEIFESADIVAYLERQYTAGEDPAPS